MNVLVCGGAGYIGSHTVRELLDNGRNVIVADSLVTGHRKAVDKRAAFYQGDLRDEYFLDVVFSENDIDAVIDFAAFSIVGESVGNPYKYFENNIGATLNLLNKMNEYGVKYIVFSSTAAVYGEPENIPIAETDRTVPTNPYGESKLCVEKILKWFDSANGIKYAALRYFNAAGAHESGEIGEDHSPETHLIPIVLQAAMGKREKISVFGGDYPTKDGTCVRDYIHVSDLAAAHILAMDKIIRDNESAAYNLGNGNGFSVKEVVDMAMRVTGREIKCDLAARRDGDPSVLIASSDKAVKELGYKSRFDTLEKIIKTAWDWHINHPDGYGDK